MYKLLIVNSERMITDLLYENLLQRMEGRLDIRKAYTGHSAAVMTAEEPPDILLTGINIPGLSGLELQKKAIHANARCKVIFLTNDSGFNNIQYALRNGSVDFILKTESNEVIYRSVEKAAKALDDERGAAFLQLRAEEQLRRTLPMLQERLILSLLSGTPFSEADFLEAEIPICHSEPVLLLMGYVDGGHIPPWIEFNRLRQAADECIAREHRVFSVIEGKCLLWLVQPRMYNPAVTFDRIRSLMEPIQRICAETFHVTISLALAETFVPLQDIPQARSTLKQSLNDLYGLSRGMRLTVNPKRTAPNEAKTEWQHIRRVLGYLEACVGSFQGGEFRRYFGELTGFVRNNPRLSRDEKAEIAARLYLVFLMKRNDDAEPSSALQFAELRSAAAPFFTFTSDSGEDWPLFEQQINAIAEAYFARQEQHRFRHTNEAVARLMNYIYNNLGDDLSLDKLTEIAHFSPTYLSRLFKQVTKVSLTEYIGRLKYEKAVQLLTGSDMKVIEIARLLGFETQSYFTRFFKKYSGVGPQEYRENARAKIDNNNTKR